TAEATTEHTDFKPMLFDRARGDIAVPGGTLGHRFSADGEGRWNLELGDLDPALSLLARHEDVHEELLPRFDTVGHGGRGDVPREGLQGQWARGYDDAEALYTPAWQETITGVPGQAAARIAREFAQNAIDSGGRSMIIMGAGTNHWFHSDTIYRSFLTLTNLC